MAYVFAALLFAHGIAHLVGFVVPWRLATLKEQPYSTSLLGGVIEVGDIGIRIIGIFWLLTALAFIAAAVALLLHTHWWRPFTFVVALFSLVLCLTGLPGAWIGILVNLVIIGVLLASSFWGWFGLPA